MNAAHLALIGALYFAGAKLGMLTVMPEGMAMPSAAQAALRRALRRGFRRVEIHARRDRRGGLRRVPGRGGLQRLPRRRDPLPRVRAHLVVQRRHRPDRGDAAAAGLRAVPHHVLRRAVALVAR